ncbi:Trk system potassium transporter TrkA [Coprobacter tertius]|uniref:Trk system potassium uptake protein TrkA n=1 Tax=Coprobacter tertius TaxID=2944915 RepID=A0ABT1MGE6_9BACT|nr:Trk system potassium transporter TrkA [Coprobacter tertius]MCP9611705.1 Trk system potassium transporter TrkA [Coprobacter tertius]
MKIIIAGAGEVGTHLAKLLSREDQDIVLIDTDVEKLQWIDANYNLMTVVGSPTSFDILKKAGVNKADLFIAVMPFETRNITACMIAANLGAQKTVARIDNYEYLLPENKAFFKKQGVDVLIYPEMLAAQEVMTALKRTWVRNWFELCNGELILIGAKLRENATILNKKLSDLTSEHNFYHIAAIKRKDETIIPRGNDEIQLNDIVYFTTTPDHIQDIRTMTGKKEVDVKKVMIMGGSRIAIRIADIAPEYLKIKLIESDRAKSFKLVEKMKDTVIIQGDGRDIDLLKEEGITDADAFIALTDNSETNILACLTAKNFGVPKTVAEVENISFITVAEGLNIGSIINKKLIAASRIYQLLLDEDESNVKCLSLADAEVAELVAKEGSKITRGKIKDISLPKDLTLGGLIREGKGLIVNGNTQIQPNDHVVVFCLDTAISKIDKLFN